MDFLQRTCRDIRSLKIQGAENVATAAILAVTDVIKRSRAPSKKILMSEVERATKKLLETRPTEAEMEDYLTFINRSLRRIESENIHIVKRQILKKIGRLLEHKHHARHKIAVHGAKLIKRNSIVFTHCHSSTVVAVVKEAHKAKKVVVHNTETRPFFQGRITAKDLARSRIPVIHFVDSGARVALKGADIMVIGADSITSTHVYNKIGSELIAVAAKELRVPLYVCASLWKFTPHKEEIEERPATEVWARAPKGIRIRNPAFEPIPFSLIKGIVCEEGVLRPNAFVKRARRLLR